MLGLFGAGGLGSLFAKQAATEAADKTQAASEEVTTEEKEAEEEEEEAAQGNGKGTGNASGK